MPADLTHEAAPITTISKLAALTPTQPSPIEGEGYERDRTPARTLKRARVMRAKPTWTEARLWEQLRLLPVRFRRQAPVGRYVADFICHSASLVVEVDGGVHQRMDVALRDLDRDAWFRGEGYETLRLTTREVEADIEGVALRIRQILSKRLGRVIENRSPFPLDGGRVGDGGAHTVLSGRPHEAAPPAPYDLRPAGTPTQPSPIEGEGSGGNR